MDIGHWILDIGSLCKAKSKSFPCSDCFYREFNCNEEKIYAFPMYPIVHGHDLRSSVLSTSYTLSQTYQTSDPERETQGTLNVASGLLPFAICILHMCVSYRSSKDNEH